ncbi:ABC transporter permease [Hymenobacter sediminis]|uniref:ABC transporter permease n=1 Tax=Hymenobacter sediminis TaxID=2218621 RepID=UPI000DA663AF|nr:ABC transporter permease [Hymenobacter sediminis]RPD50114.1 ABC transporter permease [Hymenobacter sediminis]
MKQMQRFCQNWHRALALFWLTSVVVAALLATSTVLVPDLLHTASPPFLSPHWLGTDPQGFDVAYALLQGARTILYVSIPAAALTLLLGGALGSAAGYWSNTGLRVARSWWIASGLLVAGCIGLATQLYAAFLVTSGSLLTGCGLIGWLLHQSTWGRRPWAFPIDALIAGLIVLLDSIPLLVLVLVVAAIQQPSAGGLVLLMTLTCWTTPARLMRAATLRTRELAHVEAARAAGLSDWQVLRRHIWPLTWPVVMLRLPLTIALLIGLETTLSFLGVGLPPETPSWGRLLAGIRQSPAAWWLILWPGAALVLTTLSLHQLSRKKQ